MHDIHATIAQATAASSVTAFIAGHIAGLESGLQIALLLVSIAAGYWAMRASRAKARYYERER